MKLSEKILYCRKKSGLSQEALAQKLDVSRQAVSKWETGEATPDLANLALLAKEFNVTADWLISEDEPVEVPDSQVHSDASWLDHIPGFLGRMFKKFGWIFGVYLAVAGVLFAGIGAVAKFVSDSMITNFISSFDGMFMSNPSGLGNFTSLNPVSIVGRITIIVGVVMIISGVILAIILKKRNDK